MIVLFVISDEQSSGFRAVQRKLQTETHGQTVPNSVTAGLVKAFILSLMH